MQPNRGQGNEWEVDEKGERQLATQHEFPSMPSPSGDVRTKPRVWLVWAPRDLDGDAAQASKLPTIQRGRSSSTHPDESDRARDCRWAYSWVGIKERRLSATHETDSFCLDWTRVGASHHMPCQGAMCARVDALMCVANETAADRIIAL
jgi:hypothetical protein